MGTWKSSTAAIAVILATAGTALAAKDTVEIHDGAIGAGDTTRWTAEHIYRMHSKVFVRSGKILDIEAGTLVLADSRSDSATVLVVCRGGKILARGTAAQPIVFTSELDTLGFSGALSNVNLNRGLWGGLLVFGRAPNNLPGGVGNLAGDVTGDTASLSYGDSTAPNPHDNSGIIEYVSIRYTGISDKSNIKGLQLSSVGDSTVVDHVEVYVSNEDGVELLGGTVNLKHVVSAFSAGDAFYYSQGYRGDVQFLFTIQNVIPGGASNGVNTKIESGDTLLQPTSVGNLWNVTFVSTGDSTGKSFLNTYTGKYKYALVYKKDGAGTFANSIVTETPYGGIFVDTSALKDAVKSKTSDSLGHSLVVKNNIWDRIGAGDSLVGVAMGLPYLATYLSQNTNEVVDPVLGGISWSADKRLDPRPSSTGPAYRNVATVPADGFLVQTDFRGAFGQDNWAAGWTALSVGGYFTDAANVVSAVRPVASRSAAFARIAGRSLVLELPAGSRVQVDVLDLEGRRLSEGSMEVPASGSLLLPARIHGLAVVRVRSGDLSRNLLAQLP
jgi:hypothetical protein